MEPICVLCLGEASDADWRPYETAGGQYIHEDCVEAERERAHQRSSEHYERVMERDWPSLANENQEEPAF